MYPELITRPDLKVYLPPIGGISVYIFGNPEFVSGKVLYIIGEKGKKEMANFSLP
jgi:hypothetical protein